MSKLDLADPRDFQRLTLGSAAGILQTLSLIGRDPAKWDIVEGTYNGILFHIFQSRGAYQAGLSQVQDTGGRRKVKYAFPYRDGHTTDDLGRKAEEFEIETIFHGARYMVGFKALKAELDKPTPGDLVHPVRGLVRCVPVDYQIVHRYDQRQALTVKITFTEHNFTIGDIRDQKDTTVKGALSRALDAFATIDRVITNITGAVLFAKSLRNQINQGLTEYKNRFGTSLTAMNVTFNFRGGSADIPGLLPVNQGGLRNADGTQTSTNFPVVTSPSDRLSNIPVSEVPTAVAVDTITKDLISIRQGLAATIGLIEDGANGQGALEFHDDILDLKRTGILLQEVLERGVSSSKAQVINYTVPRDMSVRELAFANGIDVERVSEIDMLNPQLDSMNLIEKGTSVRVPTV